MIDGVSPVGGYTPTEKEYSDRYGWYDPDLVESGRPGAGDTAVDVISPDPNESNDNDAVFVDDSDNPVIDPSETEQSVRGEMAEVKRVLGDLNGLSIDESAANSNASMWLLIGATLVIGIIAIRRGDS